MNDRSSAYEVDRFRAAIIDQIGLRFDDARIAFLDEVLQRRLVKFGAGSDTYLRSLEQSPSQCELEALARELTVGETYFFRNHEQFRALADVVLPERMRVSPAPQSIRLLSAGCASGEEAYSMAIVVRDAITDPACKTSIRAIDLNPTALEKARRARYSSWALRDAAPDMTNRWFRPDGREMVLDDEIRLAVTIEAGNLASDDAGLWQSASYDAIFCRNVLMYFDPAQMRAAISRIAQSLAPGGYLFLGHAETLRGVSDQFHLRHTHETFYYQLKEGAGTARDRIVPTARSQCGRAPSSNDAWFHAIGQASERITSLVSTSAHPAVDAVPPAPSPNFDLAPALDLLGQDRFAEALDHVSNGSKSNQDLDALLLQATLLAHSGQFAAAEATALRLLSIDEFNAGAHYLLALCHEHSGQQENACAHDRIAAHLDPAFAMPRLHCGLLARRAGDRQGAHRELTQALLLLAHEEPSRLLLFGGGFNRQALITLCQSALRQCGDQP